jgi:Cys-tRNA(Pro) deacylase
MSAEECPVTTGVRFLRARAISFVPRTYPFEQRGGTAAAARALSIPEHAVVKTLVIRTAGAESAAGAVGAAGAGGVLLVLMHGDREVSLKGLARALGAKKAEMCGEQDAQRLTGYLFGGTSPFGTRTPLPVYVERTIFELPRILVNGGKRGFLVEIDPADLRRAFPLTEIDVGI